MGTRWTGNHSTGLVVGGRGLWKRNINYHALTQCQSELGEIIKIYRLSHCPALAPWPAGSFPWAFPLAPFHCPCSRCTIPVGHPVVASTSLNSSLAVKRLAARIRAGAGASGKMANRGIIHHTGQGGCQGCTCERKRVE